MRNCAALVALALAAAVSLSGCTELGGGGELTKENRMAPDEAIQKQLVPYANAIGKYLGPDWKPESGLGLFASGYPPQECELPDGRTGGQYDMVWSGTGPADLDRVAQQIQKDWKSLGTDVPVTRFTDLSRGPVRALSYPSYHTGRAADGSLLVLEMTSKYAQFQAITQCFEFDWPSFDKEFVRRFHDEHDK